MQLLSSIFCLMNLQEVEWLCLVLDLHCLIILFDWLMKFYRAQCCAINELCSFRKIECALPFLLARDQELGCTFSRDLRQKPSKIENHENSILVFYQKSAQTPLIWDFFFLTAQWNQIPESGPTTPAGREVAEMGWFLDIWKNRLSLKMYPSCWLVAKNLQESAIPVAWGIFKIDDL